MPPSCGRPVSPGSSAPGPPSPRSPGTSAPTPAPAPDVGASGVQTPDPAERARELTDAATTGDRRALARLLTAIENRSAVAEAALRRLYPMAGAAHLVGITGAPGAGKSTLVAALIAEARKAGRSVGVVAVDPSSPITGGALLGDRVRMQAYASDRDVFIRSMASRGHAGGLASTSAAAASVLDACGFDLVLLETVGTGQSEVEVAAAADTTVVLEAPEMGDEIQAIKAGLLEVADIVVVNKGDRPGAQRTASQLRAMLVAVARVGAADRAHHGPAGSTVAGSGAAGSVAAGSEVVDRAASPAPAPDPRPRPKQPEVLVTTATTGGGIPELLASLDRHRAAGRDSSVAAARLARAEAQVWAILEDRMRAELSGPERRAGTEAVLRAVADHELDPFAAVDRLLGSLRG
ncbi:MAG: methylmalonyl Co-A mutase-associated GTPase MeaB [Chloroflexi bacterium]|nr:methylmalonyl Co-A mutase-associated GTPase MeaB [Chloroflexota bacterium]